MANYTKTPRSPGFEKNKGKINEITTREARSLGGKASQAVQKKKNAMRQALQLVMEMKAPERRAKLLRKRFPELSDVEINGYIEVAATLRDKATLDYRASTKLIEIMGGSMAKDEEESEKSRVINIMVASPEDAKAIANI